MPSIQKKPPALQKPPLTRHISPSILLLVITAGFYVFFSFFMPIPPLARGLAVIIFSSIGVIFYALYHHIAQKLQEEFNAHSQKDHYLKKAVYGHKFPHFFDIPVPFKNNIYSFDALFFMPRVILAIRYFPERTLAEAIETYVPNTKHKDNFIRNNTPVYLQSPVALINTLIDNFSIQFPSAFVQPVVVFKDPTLFTWEGFNPRLSPLTIPFFDEAGFELYLQKLVLEKPLRGLRPFVWKLRRYLFLNRGRVIRKETHQLRGTYRKMYRSLFIAIFMACLAALELFSMMRAF